MSKSTYNDIDELFNDLMDDLSGELGKEIGKEMVKIEQEVIDSNVYGAFTPKEYSRRLDNGGLRSEENMEIVVTRKGDSVEIEVHNATTGNVLYKNYWQGEIQDFIESGVYMWNGQMPPPRPFIDESQKRVDENIEVIFERALNKLGW